MCSSADVREDDDRRAEDVRRVQPSAEPGLDDRRVDALLRELGERGRGQRLELGRARRARPPPARAEPPARTRRRRCRAARPSRTRGERCRRPRESPAAEQRRGEPRRRRLPVRPDDVDRRVGELRVAELREQRAHPLEPELLGPRARAPRPSQSLVRLASGRAHGGSGSASRARPRPPRAARSTRTARSRASPRRARSPCAAARAPPRRCPFVF